MLHAKIRCKFFKYLNLLFLKISDDQTYHACINKISYRDKRQTFFLCYIQIYIEIFKQQLRRKYKAFQGIVIEHFVFLCLSPSQITIESILGNAFSSVLEGRNFNFFSAPIMGVLRQSLNMLPTVWSKNPWAQHWKLFSKFSFLIKMQVACNFIKTGLICTCFPVNFAK